MSRPFNALLDVPFTYGSTGNPAPTFEPAHPYIADALCAVGRAVADTAQADLDAPLTSWQNELAAGVIFGGIFTALWIAAPWLEAFGRVVAP